MARGKRPSRNYIESLVAPSEAGRVMGVSGQWVTEMCRKGSLRAYKTSLGWLIDPADVKRASEARWKKADEARTRAAEFAKRFYEKHPDTMSDLADR